MTSQNTITILTTYNSHNESFKIAKSEGKIVAINTKYIKDGKITKVLRGFEVFVAETISECIENIEREFRKKEFEALGYGVYASIVLSNGGTEQEAFEAERIMKEMLNK